jgi:hypothetical protein
MEFKTLKLEPQPFGITFYWQDKSIKITLKNGEDTLKLGREFANFLDNVKIEYTIQMENIESI